MQNIKLRDPKESDLPIFFLQQNNPVANHMAAVVARDEEAFYEHWKTKIFYNHDAIKQTILADDKIAGNMLSWYQDEKQLVGYWLGENYWGQGIASYALSEFLKQITIRPLYAYVAKHNIASTKVLEKCGFTIHKEGTQFSKVHGHEIDEILFIYK